ncbi:alpha/beta hydrolase [Oscillatoria sp. CS-180]|uniref:alpha/beta fold hydrolase n=1 Tax=Oscillatoria sp. CS-180 TaxID=3021720 RepID=UPI00232DD663|nr:alpha/beta hydrolase [Oscillatoria sp. CS-180]MDB9525597.1 alpha/beta hydrolase [Oscillatoria sp. CS-180]
MSYHNVLSVPHSYHLTPKADHTDATVVFVHGWLLSHGYWQPVIDHLGTRFQSLSYDLRGFGESNTKIEARSLPSLMNFGEHLDNDSPFSLTAYAQDLGALLTDLDLKNVWLVGHSLGGSVALWTAKLFSDQVQGVICVNAGGGVYLPDEFARFRRAGQQIVQWRPRWLKGLPFINYAFSKLMVFKPLESQWAEKRVEDLLSAHKDAALGVLLDSTTEAEVHRLPQVVAGLKQPAYFIAGAEDTVMEEKYVRHLASFHPLFESPEGNVRVLAECGHMAMLEQPETLAKTICELIPAAKAHEHHSHESNVHI